MLFPVKRLGGLIFNLALALMLGHAPLAAAEEPETQEAAPAKAAPARRDELDRWVPALSVSMGMLIQDASLDYQTSDILGPAYPDPNRPTEIRPGGSGTELMFAPIAHASLELMTPGLSNVPFVPDVAVPGQPRLFVHGDVAASFAQKYDIAREGKLEEFVFPSVFNANENEILGQGSRGQAEVGTLVWSAGAGIALTLDIYGRRVRIKPSFEWIREKITLQGDVRRLVSETPTSFQPTNPPTPVFGNLGAFRQIVLEGSESKVFDGIGPGLEIELESRRAGPVVLSTFMGGRIHRLMGDLDIDFEEVNEYGESAEFHYSNNRWVYQGYVGIRVRLVPE